LALFLVGSGALPAAAQLPDPSSVAPGPERAPPHASDFGLLEGLSEWSDAVQAEVVWPRVPFPTPTPRPADDGLVLRSTLWPVAVHAEAAVSPELARAVLDALEDASLELTRMGWPALPPDGGRGGGEELDVYLRADEVVETPAIDVRPAPLERPAPVRFEAARVDVPRSATDVDGAVTFAEMSAAVDPALVPACAVTTYADALLLSMDPAESAQWRRATAVYLAYLVTGRFGCDESLVVRQQTESWRAFVSHDPSTGEGGALLVGAISARHDAETGSFIRDLWNADQQWTPDAYTSPASELHALPDYYYVIAHGVALARDPLTGIVEDFAASRWLAGTRSPSHALAYPILGALPDAATVPAYGTTAWPLLPRSMRFDGALEPYGTAYAVCDVHDAPPGSRLRVWLRGEFGVEWSMVALRLDAHGEEIARMRAPPRPTPESFLPVELFEGTAQVVVAVTNLGARGLDADQPDDFVRSFRVAFDQSRTDETTAATE
jgi:hypothetical protein